MSLGFSSWREGDSFLVRYESADGVIRGARPLRVVGDRSGYLATWLAPGTIVAAPQLADGRDLRSVPPAERFTAARSSRIQPWRGAGILMLFPESGAHSVWLFWTDSGEFRGWYVNLERRHVWTPRGIDTRDHVLDLWCERPREWEWKDEHELEEAVWQGVVSRPYAEEIRAEGEPAARAIEAWAPPFSDGWEEWRANPTWLVPVLPEEWAEVDVAPAEEFRRR